jgi:hypothetical protein
MRAPAPPRSRCKPRPRRGLLHTSENRGLLRSSGRDRDGDVVAAAREIDALRPDAIASQHGSSSAASSPAGAIGHAPGRSRGAGALFRRRHTWRATRPIWAAGRSSYIPRQAEPRRYRHARELGSESPRSAPIRCDQRPSPAPRTRQALKSPECLDPQESAPIPGDRRPPRPRRATGKGLQHWPECCAVSLHRTREVLEHPASPIAKRFSDDLVRFRAEIDPRFVPREASLRCSFRLHTPRRGLVFQTCRWRDTNLQPPGSHPAPLGFRPFVVAG